MYEQAIDLARSVLDDVDAEPYALVEVARGLARAGDHDRALELAHSITDTRRRAGALAAVADALAKTGHPDRATELAESVPVPKQRCEALVLIADTLAKTGRHEQAATVLGRAIADARSVTDTPRNDRARAATVGALADTGSIDQAILLAGTISDHKPKVDAWNSVIVALARAEDYGRATEVARDHAAPAPHAHALALVDLLGKAGQHDRALTLARSLAGSDHFDRALHRVTDGLTRAGHCDRAARTAASISDPFVRAQASTVVARAWAAGGRHDHATALTDRIRTTIVPDIEPEQRCDVLLGLAGVADMTGCHEQASAMFDQALDTAQALPEPGRRNLVTIRVAAALASAGRYDRAVTSARTLTDSLQRAIALTEVASALADVGDYDRAISTAYSISEPTTRPDAFGWIVWHMAHRGNYNGAIALIHGTGLLGSSGWALVDVVKLTAHAGRTDDALDIAHAITGPDYRGRALAVVAEVLAGHGDHDRANAVLRTALVSSPWRSAARTLALLAPDLALEVHGKLETPTAVAAEYTRGRHLLSECPVVRLPDTWGGRYPSVMVGLFNPRPLFTCTGQTQRLAALHGQHRQARNPIDGAIATPQPSRPNSARIAGYLRSRASRSDEDDVGQPTTRDAATPSSRRHGNGPGDRADRA